MNADGAVLSPDEARIFYGRYLQACNDRRFDELGEFVCGEVAVNGEVLGLGRYADGLAAVTEAFPDFHWDLRHLLVDGCWLSAHLIDTGTTRAGRTVRTQEFALYRTAGDRIVEVWGDLDRARLVTESSRPE